MQEEIVAKLQIKNQDITRSAYTQTECGTHNIRISESVALKEIYNIPYDDFSRTNNKQRYIGKIDCSKFVD